MPDKADEVELRSLTSAQPPHRVTEVEARIIADFLPDLLVDQVELRSLCRTLVNDPVLPYARFPKADGIELRVIHTFTPLFTSFDPASDDGREGIELFINQEFPALISFNSISATRFQTDVTITDSGDGDRNARWDVPLMEFDVAYGVRTMEDLHSLIAFFRMMRGRRHAFLFHDVVDHKSTQAIDKEARKAPPISPTDQYQMTGDNNAYVFQLQKGYGPDPWTAWRPIYKPKPGGTPEPTGHHTPNLAPPVRLAKDGLEITNFTVDYATGRVTFTSDLQDIRPNVDAQLASTNPWIVRLFSATPWSNSWQVGDRLIISGFPAGPNNTTILDNTYIDSFEGGRTVMIVRGMPNYGRTEVGSLVTIDRHPCPREGKVITAGFHFWVGARFDTDRLPTSLEEYGIGAATDVKVMEVRLGDE